MPETSQTFLPPPFSLTYYVCLQSFLSPAESMHTVVSTSLETKKLCRILESGASSSSSDDASGEGDEEENDEDEGTEENG